MQNIEAYQEMMKSLKRVIIIPHHNPDADALGSSLALQHYLKKKGLVVDIISPSTYPRFLDWMPGSEEVKIFTPETSNQVKELFAQTDVIFCLDFSSYNRMRTLEPYVRQTAKPIVIIDHHLNPEMKSDFMLWNVKASSTAELIYDFIELNGDQEYIDLDIGQCIYAGIVTDTSSFKHPSTTQRVHLIAAQLMELGLDTNRVQRLIYDNNSISRMRFLGYALKEKLHVLEEFHTAYFVISVEELEKYSNQQGDTEGLVNYALSIESIHLAATIIEKHDCVKLSFRSAGNFSVNDLAAKYFSGGGHKNAAGGMSTLSIKEVEQKFLGLLPVYKEKIAKA